jgi:YgiT-type zinc finger domain-containing protein
MDRCNFCGNAEFRQTSVRYAYRRADRYLFVDDVPCEQCTQCGETYFEAKVLRRIESEFEAIQRRQRAVTSHIVVPLESFRDIPA